MKLHPVEVKSTKCISFNEAGKDHLSVRERRLCNRKINNEKKKCLRKSRGGISIENVVQIAAVNPNSRVQSRFSTHAHVDECRKSSHGFNPAHFVFVWPTLTAAADSLTNMVFIITIMTEICQSFLHFPLLLLLLLLFNLFMVF